FVILVTGLYFRKLPFVLRVCPTLKRVVCVCLLLAVLLFCFRLSDFCYCEESQINTSQNSKTQSTTELSGDAYAALNNRIFTPYCGVHAVYLAAKGFGKEIDIKEVIQPDYISKRTGSSVIDLQNLCAKFGLRNRLFTKLTTSSLKSISGCSILHVASVAGSNRYDHWMLCTGVNGNNVNILEIFDNNVIPKAISLDDIAARWDGVALVIFDSVQSETKSLIYIWCERFFIFVLFALPILLLSVIKKPVRYPKILQFVVPKVIIESVIIFLIGFVCFGMYVLLFSHHGFLPNRESISKIEKDNYLTFLPRVSTKRVESMIKDNKSCIIDVRLPSQFSAGHIEGSINIPVQMPNKETKRILQSISTDSKVIVVYEPYACAGAERVFRRVQNLGYKKLYRYEWGWEKWNKERLQNDKQ
ncbi:MAG: hypothetical protein LBC74_16225, partial [Planctomycetaceae bacterium]|nr:hypothetical protein [Planctomycetaceae bacterium]